MRASNHYNCSLLALRKLLDRWTGDEEYGFVPKINMDDVHSNTDMVAKLVDKFLKVLYSLKADNERLKRELGMYKKNNVANNLKEVEQAVDYLEEREKVLA